MKQFQPLMLCLLLLINWQAAASPCQNRDYIFFDYNPAPQSDYAEINDRLDLIYNPDLSTGDDDVLYHPDMNIDN